MKKFFLCAILLVFFVACDDTRSLDVKPTPTNTPVSQTTTEENNKIIKGDFSEKKALEFLYGNYDETQKESNWRPNKEALEKLDENSSLKEEKEFYVTSLLVESFEKAGTKNYIVVTSAIPPEHDCHACAPMIGAAIFKQNGDVWDLELDQRYIMESGSYGTPPDAKLVKLGEDNPGVLFEFGDTGQGYTTEGVLLVAKLDKEFKKILSVDTGGDNSGNCGEDLEPCWQFSSKYEFIPGKTPDFFDFKITTTGTKGGEKEIVPVDETKLYKFDGKEYKVSK